MRLRALRRAVAYRAGAAWDWSGAAAAAFGRRSLAAAQIEPERAAIERAIVAGCAFLASRQRRDGSLAGFQLAPGASTGWVTAHVAFTCEDVPELGTVRRRAALQLARTGPLDGGWGYNRRVAPDYDSTAQALLVLTAQQLEPARFLIDWLLAGQQPDGGFPTYPVPTGERHGWQTEHPDTTLMVAICLDRLGSYRAAQRARAWVERQASPAGVPSYWWEGYGYTAWLATRARGWEPRSAGPSPQISTFASPHLPWAITVAVGAGRESAPWIRGLLSLQLDDGSWPCAPCLRVTDRRHHQPGSFAPGHVVRDDRRVFSTAHAVAALHRFRALRERRLPFWTGSPRAGARFPQGDPR